VGKSSGGNRAVKLSVKQASRELLASIKARLAELDRFWEKERRKLMFRSSQGYQRSLSPRRKEARCR
jgi:hypothetical protein